MSSHFSKVASRFRTNNSHIKIKISRFKTIYSNKKKTPIQKVYFLIRLTCSYIFLSWSIFAILMFIMNFGAYSSRIDHWINPHVYADTTQAIEQVVTNSSKSITTENSNDEDLDRETIEAKLALKNPEMVYSRSYSSDALLSNIPLESGSEATFKVSPIENRIIIPKIWKNIPLIDSNHDGNSNFTEMHKVFMEELKNGVVRYPGTAKPGEQGNVFIFGHSSNYPWIQSDYNDVFALIDSLEDGDKIIVYYNQKKYTYTVTDRATVKPGDTKALQARDPNKKEISLMTCWPIGTTLERLIIFWELDESNS